MLIIVTKNTVLSRFIIICTCSSIITFKNSLLFIEFVVQYFICNTPEISIFFLMFKKIFFRNMQFVVWKLISNGKGKCFQKKYEKWWWIQNKTFHVFAIINNERERAEVKLPENQTAGIWLFPSHSTAVLSILYL